MTQLTTAKGITYFHVVHLKWLQRAGAKEIKETNHSKIEIKLYYLSTTTEMLEKISIIHLERNLLEKKRYFNEKFFINISFFSQVLQ